MKRADIYKNICQILAQDPETPRLEAKQIETIVELYFRHLSLGTISDFLGQLTQVVAQAIKQNAKQNTSSYEDLLQPLMHAKSSGFGGLDWINPLSWFRPLVGEFGKGVQANPGHRRGHG